MSNSQAPSRHLNWELTGAGFENLSLVEREVPRPGPGELLVRIDACGICFSDIKILNLGPDHPRLQGRDLLRDPVVMGHETAMTVLQVGLELQGRFQPGQRFLIQADVYYGGQGMAFGYRLPGGYSQYQVIGKEILGGDEGCYLLPVSERVSHAQAALSEPWACVEAAYRSRPRREPKADGRALLVLAETGQIAEVPDELSHLHSVTVLAEPHDAWIHDPAQVPAGIDRLRGRFPEGFDDILFYGMPSGALAREAAMLLKQDGVFSIQGTGSTGPIPVDIGSIHYRGHWYSGAPAGDPYRWGRGTELTPGGFAWFIGAGGPLGQMHVQRALSLPRPPAKLIITQNGQPRIQDLRDRFSALAEERGVELVLLDPRELGDSVYDVIRAETGGRGCDDICVVIPNAQVVEQAFPLLAHGGGMDIFAGVAVGTTANLDIGRVATEGVRLWGTSGSSIADLRQIVEKVETGQLPTDRIVAAIGGIQAVKEGLAAVKEGIYPGKTLIYPHCKDLPLLTVSEFADRHPSIRERLHNGRYWTPEAEAELLRLYPAGVME